MRPSCKPIRPAPFGAPKSDRTVERSWFESGKLCPRNIVARLFNSNKTSALPCNNNAAVSRATSRTVCDGGVVGTLLLAGAVGGLLLVGAVLVGELLAGGLLEKAEVFPEASVTVAVMIGFVTGTVVVNGNRNACVPEISGLTSREPRKILPSASPVGLA